MLNKRKILLISFATPDLVRSISRFKKQANEAQYYDEVHIATPDELQLYQKTKINKLISNGKKKRLCLLVLETINTFRHFQKNEKW